MASAHKGPGAQHTTLEQLLGWRDHQQFELIDGFPHRRLSMESRVHDAVVEGVTAQLERISTGTGWRVIPPGTAVRLGRGDEPDASITTVVRPDIGLACHPCQFDPLGLRGAPEWVAEVVTANSAVRDHIVKRQVYERVGTQEFWLIQPVERLLTIYRLAGDGQFEKPDLRELRGETELSILPGVYVKWDVLFDWASDKDR